MVRATGSSSRRNFQECVHQRCKYNLSIEFDFEGNRIECPDVWDTKPVRPDYKTESESFATYDTSPQKIYAAAESLWERVWDAWIKGFDAFVDYKKNVYPVHE